MAKKWNPRHEEWDDFATRFEETQRTNETAAEYKRMSREAKGEIKDVGGFVGGNLTDHKRSKKTMGKRTLITLDADFATEDLVLDVMSMGYTGLIYSTHSHTKENPKLRIVIPTEATLGPDEYAGVVNYFAHVLGIEQFDPTSDEPERLMYWPSTPKDGEYIYEKFNGETFNGLNFLESNPMWADANNWELSARKRKDSTKRGATVQDPLGKDGIIGAFCRVYDIHEAIETFLDDVYDRVPDSDRYTYIPGSTSNGVITYDDKWAYSHHGTDPAGSMECNAWDLVRCHLHFDEEVKKSNKAMMDWAATLPEVMQELTITAFRDDNLEDEEQNWLNELVVDRQGNLLKTANNYVAILKNDPELKGKIKYNELTEMINVLPGLPWRNNYAGSWSDRDSASLFVHIEKKWRLGHKGFLDIAFGNLMSQTGFDPIREYLEPLEWDGVPRVEKLFIDYLGAEDSEYTRTVTLKWMVAAVARAMRPGCKFDHMLIITGPQGIGKSTLLQRLAGAEWFNDSIDKMDGGKDSSEQVKGNWIVCVDELSAFKKAGASQEAAKNFITRTHDKYRPAYGHHQVEMPRRCIFAGTTNENEFLQDSTGARRFWTVQTRTKSQAIWADDFPRDQLWAEAMIYYAMDEPLFLSEEMEAAADLIQQGYTEKDDQIGVLEDFLSIEIPKDWKERSIDQRRDWYIEPDLTCETELRETICGLEIFCEMMGKNQTDFTKKEQEYVRRLMDQTKMLVNHKQTKRYNLYGKQRVRAVTRGVTT